LEFKVDTPCFTIRSIEIKGYTKNLFQKSLFGDVDDPDDPAVGRCLGAKGINLVMKRIQNDIISRGFVTTRVLAEPQDLKIGKLTLTLIPGRIHAIRFAPDTDFRATQWNAVPASPGDILNLRDIEQALENFKRVPTAEADIQITPTAGPDAKPGESDIVISWKQAFPARLSLSANDSGSRYTGKYQGAVTLSLDNMLMLNDLFYGSFTHDLGGSGPGRGTLGYIFHYSVPFGYWLFGFTYSDYEYHQTVAGASQSYRYSGETSNGELRLSRVIWRDAVRKTTFGLAGWTRSVRNYIDDTEVEVQRRRMAGWAVDLEHREFIGRATLYLNLSYRHGTGAMGSLPAPEEAFGEGSSRPQVLYLNSQFGIPFNIGNQLLSYSITLRGQLNQTPLIPLDRFAIGGRFTVRGFDGENFLIGDSGWLMRNDFGAALGSTGQEVYFGFDYGEVYGQSARFLAGNSLAGSVLGLRGGYGGLGQFSYDAFVGRPLIQPNGFKTSSTTLGFNLNWTF